MTLNPPFVTLVRSARELLRERFVTLVRSARELLRDRVEKT